MPKDGVQPVEHHRTVSRVAEEEGIVEHSVCRIYRRDDDVLLFLGTAIIIFSSHDLSEPLWTLDQEHWELDEAKGQIDGEGNPEERLFRQEDTHG